MNKFYPIYLLWGTSMGYIFLQTYYDNQKKLKKIEENKFLTDYGLEFDNIFKNK